MIAILLHIGIVRMESNETIRWPGYFASCWSWWHPIVSARRFGWFYVFRNLPGVIKWEPGRALPRRWGFGIMGLIEIGDRG